MRVKTMSIFVTGHRNPDTDSICSAIGYAALKGEGYAAGIVKNVDKNMFRVIIGSYDTKAEAARAREAFKVKYPSRADFQGAWILLNK